jgi:hypothetical protein
VGAAQERSAYGCGGRAVSCSAFATTLHLLPLIVRRPSGLSLGLFAKGPRERSPAPAPPLPAPPPQIWKTHRIAGGETAAGFSLKALATKDAFTAGAPASRAASAAKAAGPGGRGVATPGRARLPRCLERPQRRGRATPLRRPTRPNLHVPSCPQPHPRAPRALPRLRAAGVELSAGIGAACFLFGTIAYDAGPVEGPNSILFAVLCVWTAGSFWFTAGGLFLAYRHFVMRVV